LDTDEPKSAEPAASSNPTPEPAAQPGQPVAGSASPAAMPQPITIPDGAGTVVVLDYSGRRTFVAAPGAMILVGSDPGATIVVADPRVGPRLATIERKGPGWLVTSLDPANPIWLLDAGGRPHPVLEQLGLRSGTLLAGAAQLLLYPPAP
jgi:hypothetical protein